MHNGLMALMLVCSDVKPGNAMLERRADRLHLLLTDFSFSTIKGPAKR